VTGSHPEYHTPNTLNAFQDYVDAGGRLAYLGGNGFYWRIATSRRHSQCRRGEACRGRHPCRAG
jgi:N,N-dimethylformamidase